MRCLNFFIVGKDCSSLSFFSNAVFIFLIYYTKIAGRNTNKIVIVEALCTDGVRTCIGAHTQRMRRAECNLGILLALQRTSVLEKSVARMGRHGAKNNATVWRVAGGLECCAVAHYGLCPCTRLALHCKALINIRRNNVPACIYGLCSRVERSSKIIVGTLSSSCKRRGRRRGNEYLAEGWRSEMR